MIVIEEMIGKGNQDIEMDKEIVKEIEREETDQDLVRRNTEEEKVIHHDIERSLIYIVNVDVQKPKKLFQFNQSNNSKLIYKFQIQNINTQLNHLAIFSQMINEDIICSQLKT